MKGSWRLWFPMLRALLSVAGTVMGDYRWYPIVSLVCGLLTYVLNRQGNFTGMYTEFISLVLLPRNTRSKCVCCDLERHSRTAILCAILFCICMAFLTAAENERHKVERCIFLLRPQWQSQIPDSSHVTALWTAMTKDKSDKKKENPVSTEDLVDVEMADAVSGYIPSFRLTIDFHSHLKKQRRRRRKQSFLWRIYLPWHIP